MTKEFIQSLFTILHCGNGMDDVLELAEQYLNKPISLYDINYNLIAASPSAKNVSSHLTKSKNNFFLNESNTQRMQRNNMLNEINKHKSAFIGNETGTQIQSWLLCAVRIKNSFIGYLIAPTEQNISSEELELFTQLSNAISIELQKHHLFSYKSEFKYSYFLNNLLEDSFENEEIVQSRLKILSKEIYTYKRIICICEQDFSISDNVTDSIIEKSRSYFRNCISSTHQNTLVLLISQKNSFLQEEQDWTKFQLFLETHNLYACIGQEYTNIMDTPTCYKSVLGSLHIGLDMDYSKHLFDEEKLLFFQLLHSAKPQTLQLFRYHLYEAIQQYDKKNHADFIPTIRAYLENGRNSTLAAEALHVHRTTFFYRLKRMEELWNISFSDCEMLFLFEIIFRIERYLKNEN